jgi:hypothetical protein
LRFWKIKKVISTWRKRENLSKEFAQSEKKYSWRKKVNNIEKKKKLLQAYPEVNNFSESREHRNNWRESFL